MREREFAYVEESVCEYEVECERLCEVVYVRERMCECVFVCVCVQAPPPISTSCIQGPEFGATALCA